MKEQIKGFNKAYKVVERRGFTDYFCLPNTTWRKAKINFDEGKVLLREEDIRWLEYAVRNVLKKRFGKCVLCGNKFIGYGHNPMPLNQKGRACDKCNETKVMIARLKRVGLEGVFIKWQKQTK